MADIAHANRIEPLSGRVGGAAGVSLTPAGAAHRVSLRVDPAAAKTLSKARPRAARDPEDIR
jgi:sarcosine oxidase subunit gamma